MSNLFCSHKFHNIENYFIFEMLKKKIWANFKALFLPKKYGFWIRDPKKKYSGSRIQGSKRHQIPDPDPQNWRERDRMRGLSFAVCSCAQQMEPNNDRTPCTVFNLRGEVGWTTKGLCTRVSLNTFSKSTTTSQVYLTLHHKFT